MDDLDTFNRKKQFGLRERGARSDFTLTGGGVPVGGNSNPGRSIADIYDMHYIINDEIPPKHRLNKFNMIRILRKKKESAKSKPKRKCKCK